MTTVPSIGSEPSSRRMASTAAWSDFFSAPRPRKRAAATAARSVTRTISIDSTRSRAELCRTVSVAIRNSLILLDSDHLRTTRDYMVAAHRDEGLADRILAGRIGDHDHRNRLARSARPIGGLARLVSAAVALHDRFQRNVLLRQPSRDGRRGAGTIARQEPD